jgi:hypothetical protein
MVNARLKELDFHEHELVIQSLQLLQQTVNESQGIVVGRFGHVELNETGFEVLSKESAAFGSSPFDT